MMASSSSARSKPGLCLIEDEYWYAGPLSERKAEVILTKLSDPGSFLVRDSLLPDADYVLSVNSGKEIWHYDIKILPSNECIFNKYTFSSLPDAVTFYMENRLGSVYLREPEEPVVKETQLKSTGPKLIKAAAPESIKPPRTSPFTSPVRTPQVSELPASDLQPTSSPQTRKLVAPESLRRPQTPPIERHTPSPRRSRKLAAPESLKRPQTPPAVQKAERYHTSSPKAIQSGAFYSPHHTPLESYATASPLAHRREPEDDREAENNVYVNSHPLNALPRSSAFGGDGWLDSHSGAGSQVSIGSHSPKPQSVKHFVVDLQEDGGGGSRSQSQKSEVDSSYILPSTEVESVFVSSGYLYVAPQYPDFNEVSQREEASQDKQTLKEKQPQSGEGDKAGRKHEICETQFNSSADPTTAILNTPPSEESTPARQGRQPIEKAWSTDVESEKNEKGGTSLSRKDSSGSNSDEVFSEKADDTNQHQSVAERKLAFERQIRAKENGAKPVDTPAILPPTVPKRVSSISSVDIEDKNGAESIKSLAGSLSAPCKEEAVIEEENRPPPPPMSTHPGLTNKLEVDRQAGEEKENEKSKIRPKPKERRISIPTVKPRESVTDQKSTDSEKVSSPTIEESRGEPSNEAAACVIVVEENSKENSMLVTPPLQDGSLEDGRNTEGVSGQQNGEEATDYFEEESPSTGTFGHSILPLERSSSFRETSEQQHIAEQKLNNIDPSKQLGTEVSTFKPTPKPRSFQRHSMYITSETPTVVEPPNYSSLSPLPDQQGASNASSLLTPPSTTRSYTPDMKRSSINFPSPMNKREMLLRAQSMSILPTHGSASPRMVMRGEQRSQMPPGFVVFSRSQEAVIGRHASMSTNMALRTIKPITASSSQGEKKSTATVQAAPMNTKRTIKKRRSIFRKK